MSEFLTTREAADHISGSPLISGDVAEWKIRRLFEDGTLSEPPKFGGKRMIAPTELPSIVDALRNRGWLTAEASADA
jgi:hypothetical protein